MTHRLYDWTTPSNWTVTAATMRHVHATLTVVWALLAIPTLLWWRQSVLWVALMSLWANVASHFAGWQAARAEAAAERSDS